MYIRHCITVLLPPYDTHMHKIRLLGSVSELSDLVE